MTTAHASPESPAARAARPVRVVERGAVPDLSAEASPVLIHSGMADSRAVGRWNLEYMKGVVSAEKSIMVATSRNGVFRQDADLGHRIESMTFQRFGEYLLESEPREHYYLMQTSIPEHFPGLMPDIVPPEPIRGKRLTSTNLWMGRPGTVAPLHYDCEDNVLAQILGTKRVVLYPLGDWHRLYPQSVLEGKIPHISRVDIERPDMASFPRFARARPFECILEAGDMLFIPAGWWHQVYTLSLSMSVNFWWRPSWRFWLTPPGLWTQAARCYLRARDIAAAPRGKPRS